MNRINLSAYVGVLVLLAGLLLTPNARAQDDDSAELDIDSNTVETELPPRPAKPLAKSKKPKPTSTSSIPLLPNGKPDRSKFPNPFVVKYWTFGVGGAIGNGITSVQTYSYEEVAIEANAYFYDFLDWHNDIFTRFGLQGVQIYGLDTSERFIYRIDGAKGLALIGAPGFRFASQIGTMPYLEAGAAYTYMGFTLSAGAREFFGSIISTGEANETQYFLQLASGIKL